MRWFGYTKWYCIRLYYKVQHQDYAIVLLHLSLLHEALLHSATINLCNGFCNITEP